MSTSSTMSQTIPEKLSDHEARLRVLEANAGARCQPTKSWWLSKGFMGPLASGVATGALVVGYVAGWPADALASLAAIAGGGSVTGIIGRLRAKAVIK